MARLPSSIHGNHVPPLPDTKGPLSRIPDEEESLSARRLKTQEESADGRCGRKTIRQITKRLPQPRRVCDSSAFRQGGLGAAWGHRARWRMSQLWHMVLWQSHCARQRAAARLSYTVQQSCSLGEEQEFLQEKSPLGVGGGRQRARKQREPGRLSELLLPSAGVGNSVCKAETLGKVGVGGPLG